MAEKTVDRTIESDVDETLEAVAHERAVESVEDVLGSRGVARIESISHCRLEDLPRAHRARFTRRDYVPDDVENMTDEYIAAARDSHEADDMPRLLRDDAFLEIRLSYDQLEFSVYHEREPDSLDKIASYCNVDDPAKLIGRGVPVTRRGDTYHLLLWETAKSTHTFEGSLAGMFAKSDILPVLTLVMFCASLFAGLAVASMVSGASLLLAPVAFIATLIGGTLSFHYGSKAVLYGFAALYVLRTEGSLWPSNLYAKNFDGWRDYLFG